MFDVAATDSLRGQLRRAVVLFAKPSIKREVQAVAGFVRTRSLRSRVGAREDSLACASCLYLLPGASCSWRREPSEVARLMPRRLTAYAVSNVVQSFLLVERFIKREVQTVAGFVKTRSVCSLNRCASRHTFSCVAPKKGPSALRPFLLSFRCNPPLG